MFLNFNELLWNKIQENNPEDIYLGLLSKNRKKQKENKKNTRNYGKMGFNVYLHKYDDWENLRSDLCKF